MSRPVRLHTAPCSRCRLLRLASPSDPNCGQRLSRERDSPRNSCGILFWLGSIMPSGHIGSSVDTQCVADPPRHHTAHIQGIAIENGRIAAHGLVEPEVVPECP